MAKKHFAHSLQVGSVGEDLAIKAFANIGRKCVLGDGKKHDLILDGQYIVEVKYDIMSKKTGNIAIEYWNSKKNEPSGISATLAKYWVHIAFDKIGNTIIFVVKVDELKDFIKNTKPKKIIKAGGDDNADLYIYGLDVILNTAIFSRLDLGQFNE